MTVFEQAWENPALGEHIAAFDVAGGVAVDADPYAKLPLQYVVYPKKSMPNGAGVDHFHRRSREVRMAMHVLADFVGAKILDLADGELKVEAMPQTIDYRSGASIDGYGVANHAHLRGYLLRDRGVGVAMYNGEVIDGAPNSTLELLKFTDEERRAVFEEMKCANLL